MPFFNPAVEPSSCIGIAARQSLDGRGLPECTEPTLADRMHDRLDGGLRCRALAVEQLRERIHGQTVPMWRNVNSCTIRWARRPAASPTLLGLATRRTE